MDGALRGILVDTQFYEISIPVLMLSKLADIKISAQLS